MQYQLKLNKAQLDTVAEALEFFSRFCAGQWRLPDTMEYQEYKNQDKYDGFWEKRNYVEDQLNILKSHFTGLQLNASYGIGSANLCDSAKIAYDVYRPILELRAEEYNKANPDEKHYSVYDHPGLQYSKEGRIKIKTLEDG